MPEDLPLKVSEPREITNCYAEVEARGGALRYTGGPHLSYVFRGRRGLF